MRKCFFSFHFENDVWRAGQVRNIGAVEGNAPVASNDWEKVKKSGDGAIQAWIDDQMKGVSCVIVLIGTDTHTRPWVRHEIKRAWELGKGIVGVHIHGLEDTNGETSKKGQNPLDQLTVGGVRLSSIFKTYSPSGTVGTERIADIKRNLGRWVDEGVAIRANYS